MSKQITRSNTSAVAVRAVVADKREAILRAAVKVFARKGFFNSKVADIAREAGIADGTVYLYFKSKDEILHSVFDRAMENLSPKANAKLKALSSRIKDCKKSPGFISNA